MAARYAETPGENIVTAEGIQAKVRATTAAYRGADRFIRWPRKSLMAYCRTGKGPIKSWLARIGEVQDATCPECDQEAEDGEHITFRCRALADARKWGEEAAWEELDKPIWVEPEGAEKYDAVEAFFRLVHQQLADRRRAREQ